MEFLLDASALVYVITSRKQQKLDRNCHVLDLTYYEYGNAMVNLLAKRKGNREPSKEDIQLFVKAFEKTTELLTAINLDSMMMQAVIELALKENLTFYDASYLYACSRFGYHLVTEDRKLAKAAQNNSIKAVDSERWAKL